METAPHLDVISQNTEFQNVPPDHARTDNIVSFDKGRVNLKIGGNDYSAEVVIGVKDDGNKVFYDIVGMDANKRRPPSGSQSAQTANTRAQEPSDNISSNDSITDTSENFKSKSENSAAKAQQAETEEEARLRTLYESEPTGKYAETEAGESKAELDEKVKEAKENAVGDDELKEKPKTEKQKILKRRIEKAGLDMTVEEIVGFAQGLGRIKGFFGSERKDFARIFDDVSEGSRTIRNDLHKLLEVPHRQAQAQYTEGYKNAIKSISEKFGELGIKAGKNNYRTHKVLNEINLMETSTGETRPRRVAEDATPGLQGTNSALSVESSPRLDAQGTESSSLGDVPSPKTNIPPNGNGVNSKEQANFEKAVQKKAPGVFAPGAFVQLLKVKELFLAFHFCIALAAINRTILSGFERNFCFAAAGSAGGGVHFFLGFDFVFACIAALFATLGLVNEAALCIEFLFAGGESELFSAFFAH